MAHSDSVKVFVWIRLLDYGRKVLAHFPDANSIPYVMEDTYKDLGFRAENLKVVSEDRIINGEDVDGFWLYPLRDYSWELVG